MRGREQAAARRSLAPARGPLLAVALGITLWGAIIAAVLAIVRRLF